MPAATAPELTTTICLSWSCSDASSSTNPRMRASSMPELEERIWLPILITARRARRSEEEWMPLTEARR